VPPSVVVVIREDPQKSHRAVEALRIALGLSAGENPLSVVLLGHAPLLLGEDPEGVVDADILEKYLPSFKQLGVPLVVPLSARSRYSLNSEFTISESSQTDIAARIAAAARVLVF
jgi:sulfur relay (sulfurtransferase) DsrF/TusC family protein